MAFNGKRFLSVPLTIRDTLMKTMTGDATLYFVSVSEEVLLLIPILSLLSYPVFLMEILEILL